MHLYALTAIVIVSWVIACVSCAVSILLAVGRVSGRTWASVVLAIIAIGIGYLGYGRWSPFRFFPQLGWMWSSDNFEIYISSSTFFLAPLVIGIAGLLVAAWKGIGLRYQSRKTPH